MGKKVCLIDYENTAFAGLDGMEGLSAGDHVRIICSNENIGNTLQHVLSVYQDRGIGVEVEIMTQRGQNALDFRISCDLGYFIAQPDVEQIYVVSKDNGYLHAISEASALNSDVAIVKGVSIGDALQMAGQKEEPPKTVRTEEKPVKALDAIIKKMPAAGKNKSKAKGDTKAKPAAAQEKQTLTKKQQKDLHNQIANYIKQTTQINEKYCVHIAALILKESSVMEFRRAAKRALGKQYEKFEPEVVGVYMHFKQGVKQ